MTFLFIAWLWLFGWGCAFLSGAWLLTPTRPRLPRRVPGAALVDNPPPDEIDLTVAYDPSRIRPFTFKPDPSQTIGDRARQRRDAVRDYYEQKAGGW